MRFEELNNKEKEENKEEIDNSGRLIEDAEKFLDFFYDNQKLQHFTEREKMNRSSIKFQQDMIEYIKKNENNPKKINEIWEEYDEVVDNGVKIADNAEKRKKIRDDFFGIKVSIIGSLATINFFEDKGFDTEYPSIEEDMVKKCDLRFVKEDSNLSLAVQLKSLFLSDLSKKEINKIIDNLILTDEKFIINQKYKKDFSILSEYCQTQDGNCVPVFIQMPVAQSQRGKGRRTEIVKIIKTNGEINNVLQKSLDMRWEKSGIDRD